MRTRSWLSQLRRSSSVVRGLPAPTRRASFRPRLESLEDLVLLSGATFTPAHLLSSSPILAPQGPGGGPSGLTPAQVRHAYGFDQITFNNGSVAGNGSGETIAIVDAYDDPSIANDLAVFDSQFGLAAPPTFTKVGINASGQASTTQFPTADSGWAGEIELDVEWAHAIAPGAKILLVEANSASDTDLMRAVNYARNAAGVVAVSLSWGGSEFSGESSYDTYFTTPAGHAGVTFFASSGDSGSPGIWPAISTHVVGVGGSTLSVTSQGTYQGESGWSGSGGGLSVYLSQPSYQSGLTIHNGTSVISANGKRTTPDVSYDADPNSGFSVYGTYGWGGWAVVGGTSDAAPQWAALTAIADQGLALAGKGSLDDYTQALPALYGLSAADFHDVIGGSNGGFQAGPGYDLVTGRGSPIANLVVRDLAGGGGSTTNQPPTIATAAQVVSQTTTTARLHVLGADDGGEANLTYTWAAIGGSPAGATFSANGTNAAKDATVTFAQAGTYTLQVTVTDLGGLSVTSQVTVTTSQALTSVTVAPGTATVAPGGTQQFTATARDQYGNPMAQQPAFTWSLTPSTLGTISSAGLFTAAQGASGTVTVQASASGLAWKGHGHNRQQHGPVPGQLRVGRGELDGDERSVRLRHRERERQPPAAGLQRRQHGQPGRGRSIRLDELQLPGDAERGRDHDGQRQPAGPREGQHAPVLLRLQRRAGGVDDRQAERLGGDHHRHERPGVAGGEPGLHRPGRPQRQLAEALRQRGLAGIDERLDVHEREDRLYRDRRPGGARRRRRDAAERRAGFAPGQGRLGRGTARGDRRGRAARSGGDGHVGRPAREPLRQHRLAAVAGRPAPVVG
jgi:hypothetical protein